jgi:hypothetical protein
MCWPQDTAYFYEKTGSRLYDEFSLILFLLVPRPQCDRALVHPSYPPSYVQTTYLVLGTRICASGIGWNVNMRMAGSSMFTDSYQRPAQRISPARTAQRNRSFYLPGAGQPTAYRGRIHWGEVLRLQSMIEQAEL